MCRTGSCHTVIHSLWQCTVQSATAWVCPSQGMKSGYFKGNFPTSSNPSLGTDNESTFPAHRIEFCRHSYSRCTCSHEGMWDRVSGFFLQEHEVSFTQQRQLCAKSKYQPCICSGTSLGYSLLIWVLQTLPAVGHNANGRQERKMRFLLSVSLKCMIGILGCPSCPTSPYLDSILAKPLFVCGYLWSICNFWSVLFLCMCSRSCE